MKKLLLSVLTITVFGFGAKAQNVNIPDANFKAFLLASIPINTNGDTEIQISEAIAVTGTIDCSNLSISDLTGIEAFTALANLVCYNNSLTSLDVTQNTALTTLDCSSNYLTNLNVANGNNSNFPNWGFKAAQNPNLICIQVDNVAYSTTNWTNIDATASFSLNCNGSVGVNEQVSQSSLTVYPNPATSQLTLQLQSRQVIENVSIMDVTGKTVKTIITNNNTIDVSNLVKGIYFLQVQTEKGIVNSKFIKE